MARCNEKRTLGDVQQLSLFDQPVEKINQVLVEAPVIEDQPLSLEDLLIYGREELRRDGPQDTARRNALRKFAEQRNYREFRYSEFCKYYEYTTYIPRSNN